jgi:HK97 family phage major capsid protein
MKPEEIIEQKLKELEAKYDAKLKEIEAKAATGETNAEFDAKLQKSQEEAIELKQRLDALETEMNRPGQPQVDEAAEAEARKEFDKFMRKRGYQGDLEIRAMSVDSDPDGGYLVMPTMSSNIITRVFESSPIRQLASVQTISSDALEMMIDDEEAGSGWVGEREARSETDTPQIGMKSIPVHELHASPKATQKLLDDASVNVEAWLAGKVSDKFARMEESAFVAGNGIAKPRGFLTYPAASGYERGKLEQIVSGVAGAFTADGFIDLQNALKEAYQGNAVFVMKRASFGSVRKLKDGQGQYLLGIGADITGVQQMTLLGKPVRFADDMPAVGSNALSCAYGDFRQGYTVVDRVGIRVLRDPYTATPFIKFYTTKRVGGDVTNYEAIKIQKLASA